MSVEAESKRIMFCDDDKETLSVLVELAGIMGYEAHGFSDAREFIAQIENIKPDVIVSDIDMPEMNGHQLFRELQKEQVETPFIFLTGHPSIENYRQGLLQGHFEFLSKPIAYDILDDAIRKALAFGAKPAPSGKLAELLEHSLRVRPANERKAI